MNAREAAWRMFASELNSSTLEKKGNDEKSPSYVVTPLGAMVNRVLITGVLTDKENRGTDEEPMWSGRVQDVTGNFFISVGGRYQPEAAAAMLDLDTPSFVAIVGKLRSYTTDDGRVYISVRPEHIVEIDDGKRNMWILEAAKSMWSRLLKMKQALQIPDVTAKDLIGKGYSAQEAEGIIMALDHYGFPESTKYLKLMQSAMRLLLPDRDVDLGLPGDTSDMPDEIEDMPQNSAGNTSEGANSIDKEDILLRILDELDNGPDGAPIDEIERSAEMEGISAMEIEEISNSLMDKGLVYEPKLGYLKKI